VERWSRNQPRSSLFITTTTQAELLYGIETMAKGKRRTDLKTMVESTLDEDFRGRVLPFDMDAARAFAIIMSVRKASGRPMAIMDAQIAAIARSRGASLATRNTGHFEQCGVRLINPWQADLIQ
jgi:predicted nucleic acid-binding protein